MLTFPKKILPQDPKVPEILPLVKFNLNSNDDRREREIADIGAITICLSQAKYLSLFRSRSQ